jgi:putative SOS response-associated peptidase YedK
MCGRYRRTTAEEEIARQFHIPIPPQLDLPISYNIAPTQNVLAIRRHPESGERTLDALRWGLIPNWAKDEKIAYKTINARVETVDTAPSYRQAFKKRRCLIPADGFYEWRKVAGGKIPYNIQMKDGRPFAFAGLWEGWKRSETEDWIRTCTIITGEPNELLREIHTRMPVIHKRLTQLERCVNLGAEILSLGLSQTQKQMKKSEKHRQGRFEPIDTSNHLRRSPHLGSVFL